MKLVDAKVAVGGLGYVGLPLALAFGRKIHTIGFDISEPKLTACRAGYDPIGETGSEAFRQSSRLAYTDDISRLCEAGYVVAVPTSMNNKFVTVNVT